MTKIKNQLAIKCHLKTTHAISISDITFQRCATEYYPFIIFVSSKI